MRSIRIHYEGAVAATGCSPLLHYCVALFSVAGAISLAKLVPDIHKFTPFLLYIVAVLISTSFGGQGPGVLCSVLAILNAPGWVLTTGSLPQISHAQPLPLSLFVLIAMLIVLIDYALRRTRGRRAGERQHRAAQLQQQESQLDHVGDGNSV
jgi:K+-sensing histidine kinase KdpD